MRSSGFPLSDGKFGRGFVEWRAVITRMVDLYKIEPWSNIFLSLKTTWCRFYDCNFAVSLDGFATVHRPVADVHFKLTRDFQLSVSLDGFATVHRPVADVHFKLTRDFQLHIK